METNSTKNTVHRVIKPMPEFMKKELRQKKFIAMVNERIRANTNRVLIEPNKTPIILPMGFTGRDLQKAKSMLKKYKEQRG